MQYTLTTKGNKGLNYEGSNLFHIVNFRAHFNKCGSQNKSTKIKAKAVLKENVLEI